MLCFLSINVNTIIFLQGETGAEPQEEDPDITQAEVTDGDIMDGEAETDTVVIAGQPEVLSTQEMQVSKFPSIGTSAEVG